MSETLARDVEKERFQAPTDPAIQSQLDQAMSGVNVDALLDSEPVPVPAKLRGLQSGAVINIDLPKDEVLVELTGKMNGIARFSLFQSEPKIRDVVEVTVEKFDPRQGVYICTPKGAPSTNTDWDSLDVGTVVEGIVNGMNKGGLEVKVGNLRAFMPAGQIDLDFHKDISIFLSQKVTVEVTQIDKADHRLVVSRKKILERAREESRGKLLAELEEGQTRQGTVRSVVEFGAFVDLGGADGLIHISELTYNRHLRPTDVVNVGDQVEVKIVKIDKETGKIGLSLKQARPDPWKDIEAKYPIGTKVTARVVKIESFGAFIEVEEGVQGLLPLSEMSWQRIRNPNQIVQVGQTIPLAIIAVDATGRRMTFSIKQAGPDPWADAAAKYGKHSIHDGKILRTAEFGAFIELEPNVEGLAHISELSDKRVNKVEEAVKVGDTVKVRVIDVDVPQRRMSLSLKKTDGSFAPPPPPPPPKPPKIRKVPLRGGLDF